MQHIAVNGVTHQIDGASDAMLLDVLREQLGLTGSKIGCGEGACGACTVLVNGQPTHACITPVSAVTGQQVLTLEGLAQDGVLHPLQQAFLDQDALQCGYCTPGMIMSGVGLLQQNGAPSFAEVVEFMQGNICRCGTYPRIVKAIQQAAAARTNSTGGRL